MKAIREGEREAVRRLMARQATGGGESASHGFERIWEELELPPTAGAAPGFTTRVLARARSLDDASTAPALRWASAVALAAGIALGSLIALNFVPTPAVVSEEGEVGIAESYLDELIDPSTASLVNLERGAVAEGEAGESGAGGS